MKLCGHCSEYKDERLFPRNRSKRDGLGGWCKACCRFEWSVRTLRDRGVRVRDINGRIWIQPELPL